jgi:hypothetical protein
VFVLLLCVAAGWSEVGGDKKRKQVGLLSALIRHSPLHKPHRAKCFCRW